MVMKSSNKFNFYNFQHQQIEKKLNRTMAAALIMILANRQLNRERVFLNKSNPLESLDDERLIQDYRFPRSSILQIVSMCDNLRRPTRRNQALPVHLQVLATLRFYAKGVFQRDLQGITGISQSKLSRVIQDVSTCIVNCAKDYIKMPTTDSEIMAAKHGFFSLAGFPNVIGAIDGSLINKQAPSGPTEPMFVGRKGDHCINVQVICDANMKFLDIVAKYPGATHDSFIWRNCGLRSRFVANRPNGYLLGDSGYALEPWLIPPFADCNNDQSREAFNIAHKKTRRIVENAIGLWKNCFRRIHKWGGMMIYKPTRTCKIISATAVLHNIRRDLRLPEDEQFEDDETTTPAGLAPTRSDNEISREGVFVRNEIVNNFF